MDKSDDLNWVFGTLSAEEVEPDFFVYYLKTEAGDLYRVPVRDSDSLKPEFAEKSVKGMPASKPRFQGAEWYLTNNSLKVLEA